MGSHTTKHLLLTTCRHFVVYLYWSQDLNSVFLSFLHGFNSPVISHSQKFSFRPPVPRLQNWFISDEIQISAWPDSVFIMSKGLLQLIKKGGQMFGELKFIACLGMGINWCWSVECLDNLTIEWRTFWWLTSSWGFLVYKGGKWGAIWFRYKIMLDVDKVEKGKLF